MQSTSGGELRVHSRKDGEFKIPVTIFKETPMAYYSDFCPYCARDMTTMCCSIRPSHDQNHILTHQNCQKGHEGTAAVNKSAFAMPSEQNN